MSTVAVIGAAGAGKTTVGRALSRLMDVPFFDTDIIIEAQTGLAVKDLFALYGEGRFRQLERDAVAQAVNASERTGAGAVIAVGGGAVMSEENAHALKRAGRILWLRRDIELLELEGRPLYKNRDTARRLFIERAPIYEKLADIIVDNSFTVESAALEAFHKIFT